MRRVKRDECVERDGDQLQGYKDKNEIGGRSHPHHAGASQYRNGVEFAETGLRRYPMDESADGVGIVDRHDQHDDGGDQGELFEEQSGLILGITGYPAGLKSYRTGEAEKRTPAQ